ncbi:MAG: hypothetical protein CMG07_04965 [Candidatus Marinimicrobia bacterium]|nr:hypothetical protein [Candidatus Neomarinimicrobiota bacterium]
MSVRVVDNKLFIFNPSTGEDIGTIKSNSKNEISDIIDIASKKASNYNHSSFYTRTQNINRLRKSLIQNMDDFIDIICKETGKKYEESLTEILTSVEYMKYAVKILPSTLKPKKRKSGILFNKRASISYEPHGVAALITPWNYPLILTITPITDALLAGNTVVIKPSEQTPFTVKLIKELWDSCSNEPDLLQVVYGCGDVGNEIVKSKKTNIVSFTGSTVVGRKIAETCATLLKPVILELGGKDPMIILDDANIERAANAALWGGLSNAGQTCTSIENIFIHSSVKKQFISFLKDEIKKLDTGPSSTDHIGSITVENSKDKILSQISELKDDVEMIQGSVNENSGWFIPPTIIIDPPSNAKVMQEETFGPVMTLNEFDDINELITKINHQNEYGLSASIFTKNKLKAKQIAKKLVTGTVNINDVLSHYGISDLPFGGVGSSGFSRVHGKEGLIAFCRIKSLLEDRFSLKTELWWYHKKNLYIKLVKKFIKFYYN